MPFEQIAGHSPFCPALRDHGADGGLVRNQARCSLAQQRQGLPMNGKVSRLGKNRALEHSFKLRAGLKLLQSLAR